MRKGFAFAALAAGFALLISLLAGTPDESTGQRYQEAIQEYESSIPQAGVTLEPKPHKASNKDKAVLRIPVLGKDWVQPILAGVGDDVLDSGVLGRFPESTVPGGVGNYSLTGHRVTNGEPFRYLTMVEKGDRVYLDSAGMRYVYTIRKRFVVDFHDVSVLDSDGRKRLITLITCDSYTQHTDERFVVQGTLTGTETL